MMARPTPLYHITHMRNLASIAAAGGLRAHNVLHQEQTEYTSIAHQTIQDRRATTQVPCGPGGTLHDYVPFYFAERSPMLYTLYRGNVEGHAGGQEPIIHLVTSVEAVQAAGRRFVFTDGHAIMAFTAFHTDLAQLDIIDWEVMQAQYWADTAEDPDRKRRRQAEFLIYETCPWSLIQEIGVISRPVQAQVEHALRGVAHRPPVTIHRDWYY